MPRSAKSSDYILLTGATGLLGRYLLRDLLSAGHRVAVLVRDSRTEPARERIESVMQYWEQDCGYPLPRPVVLTGDVKRPGLGLSPDDLEWARGHVVSLLHSAALVKFEHDDRDGEPYRTNHGGTCHVLDFCLTCRIDDLHYISTAFICGKREGTIREGEFDCGQEFHNTYEESKFRAEQAVRNCRGIRHRTVYRPTIITADSETGYTNTYFGMMWYLKLLAVLVPQQPLGPDGKRQTPIELPVSGDEPHNLVPVNWVSRVIVHLLGQEESRGQTFHLASPHSVTMRGVVDVCYGYFGSTGVKYVGSCQDRLSLSSDFARSFFASSRSYRDYDRYTPCFDRTNLMKLAGHIECPPIDDATIIRFLEFGKRDHWGKRRRKRVAAPVSEYAALQRLLEPERRPGLKRLINGYSSIVGVDVLGPGGGQWRLVPERSGLAEAWQLHRGLGPHGLPVCSLTSAELAAHAECSAGELPAH